MQLHENQVFSDNHPMFIKQHEYIFNASDPTNLSTNSNHEKGVLKYSNKIFYWSSAFVGRLVGSMNAVEITKYWLIIFNSINY